MLEGNVGDHFMPLYGRDLWIYVICDTKLQVLTFNDVSNPVVLCRIMVKFGIQTLDSSRNNEK